MNIDSLQRKKRVITRQLTRIHTSLEKEINSAEQVKYFNNELRDLRKQFNGIQGQIESAVSDADFERQLIERDEFEDNFNQVMQVTLNLTSALNMSESKTVNQLNSPSVRLPKVNLPSFDGNHLEWLNFRDLFVTLVHHNDSLSKIQRFQYLKSSLIGRASNLLASLAVTEENYDDAWELLNERFDNKRLLISEHYNNILSISPLNQESAEGLRQLLDKFVENMRSLKNLKADSWDQVMMHLLVRKLDLESSKQWVFESQKDDKPTFEDVKGFLQSRCQALEAFNNNANPRKGNSSSRPNRVVSNYAASLNCQVCGNQHSIYKCDKFMEITPTERLAIVKKKSLCFNCLAPNHTSNKCYSASRCKVCYKTHHTLLHNTSEENISYPVGTETQESTSVHLGTSQVQNTILLSTASVLILNVNGKCVPCRALLDSVSQSNFMTSACASRLGLKQRPHNVTINGIADTTSVGKHVIECTIISRVTHKNYKIHATVLPKLTTNLPTVPITIADLSPFKNLPLADPAFRTPGEIDVLLGAGTFFEILMAGSIHPPHGPILRESTLGWIAAGKCENLSPISVNHSSCYVATPMPAKELKEDSLEDILTKFWEIEEISINERDLSLEEADCEDHFIKTTIRDATGRYIVRLPFKERLASLGDSYSIATNRLFQVERRLAKDVELREQYVNFMAEYLELEHMSPVKSNSYSYLLPHHSVLKADSTTTRVRVVFDASAAPLQGVSLNSMLAVGPKVQDDLFALIIRFRFYNIALISDITKMYRQILIHPEDRKFQHILWRENPLGPIREYELNTVTYGTSSASFLATRTLQHLGESVRQSLLLASEALTKDFYMDDYLAGADTVDAAKHIQIQLREALQSAGMNIRKWASNSVEALEGIPTEDQEISSTVLLTNDKGIKTLGLKWQPALDLLSITSKINLSNKAITKRNLLSDVATVFDPLGLVSPLVTQAKCLFQRLWLIQSSWDEVITDDTLLKQWYLIRAGLIECKNIAIERKIKCDSGDKFELHGFSDASQQAYAAAVYVKSVAIDGRVTSNLLCSKTRVAPLKNVSLPRLELCGALLLARLIQKVQSSLKRSPEQLYFWTDSTIVLSWLADRPSRWNTFVSNRVSEIQALSEPARWSHVSSKDNPADIPTRSIKAEELKGCDLWWKGPHWIVLEPGKWPKQPTQIMTSLETRKVVNCCATVELDDGQLFTLFSNYTKLIHVNAFIFRFFRNCKKLSTVSGTLTMLEIEESKIRLIKLVQGRVFSRECKQLREGGEILSSSKILPLNPFIDPGGVLRVGGRLKNSNLSYSAKHPIILPGKHPFSVLLIQYYHLKYLHAGMSLTLNMLRQRYWLTSNARTIVRQQIKRCVKCRRYSGQVVTPLMGDLPQNRVNPSLPFTCTGVDYAGPVGIKQSFGRSPVVLKSYIAIFICFATKAVHIEPVLDLRAESFIASLRRFVSRRGTPKHIYSDNSTTFVGANSQMKEWYQAVRHNLSCITQFSLENGISWHFIPPRAPHMGGLWEAAVKSLKRHLNRVMEGKLMNFDQLHTLLIQIESCLNSRPLLPLSNHPEELDALTPNHFLIGQASTSLPHDCSSDPITANLKNRWQDIQKSVNQFWTRWSVEYLHQLQQRGKWRSQTQNVKINDLVIIKEDNLPPQKWLLGRIVATFTGDDNQVRVVQLKTKNGFIKRSVTKLILLVEE